MTKFQHAEKHPPKSRKLDELVDEVCGIIESGQQADLERLVESHPDFAEEIRNIHRTLMAIDALDHSIDANEMPSRDVELGGERLGDFQILRQIGRGGMGVVYEAQQLSIPRRVALKILPLAALVDPRALQRFKNEVAAIATLEHPHIVSVYAIGEDRGIHYFAMQLIHGQSLAVVIRELRSRVDRDGTISGAVVSQVVSDLEHESYDQDPGPVFLSTEQRANDFGSGLPTGLDSFSGATETRAQGRTGTSKGAGDSYYFRNVASLVNDAAHAIQHAHDHGIVHRDVKPGNLLLDPQGGLFVTDFGLARMETAAGVTMTGDVMGTLRYMSPEQVLANRVIIDHRTDIYSLGVTLYELLTLEPMWSGSERAELLRKISFEEPVRPKKVNPCIPADLETIVLKATSKNPIDRYNSADDFGDDLQRFLNNRPISARRPSVAQRVFKWTRRNPAILWSTVATLAITILFLLFAIIGMAYSNQLISNERNNTKKALDAAQTESATVKAINDFINHDLLGSADPHSNADRNLNVYQVLEKAVFSLENRFLDQPIVEAGIRATMGRAFANLGRLSDAKQQLNLAKLTMKKLLESNDPKLLAVQFELLKVEHLNGQYLASVVPWSELLKTCRRTMGMENELTLQVALGAARNHTALGKTDKALELVTEVVDISEKTLGVVSPISLLSRKQMIEIRKDRGEFDEVEKLGRRLLNDYRSALREDHPETLAAKQALSSFIFQNGKLEEAVRLNREAHEAFARVLGPDSQDALDCLSTRAAIIYAKGRSDEAEDLVREILVRSRRAQGDEHPETVGIEVQLADMISAGSHQHSEAEAILRKTLEIRARFLPPEHPTILRHNIRLARAISKQKNRFPDAEALFRKIWKSQDDAVGPEHPDTLMTICYLARSMCFYGKNRNVEAEQLMHQVLEVGTRVWNPDHPHLAYCWGIMANILLRQGRAEEAEKIYRAKWVAQKGSQDFSFVAANALQSLVWCLSVQNKWDEAEPLARELLTKTESLVAPEHPHMLLALFRLGLCLQRTDKLDQAEKIYQRLYDGRKKTLGVNNERTISALLGLALVIGNQQDRSEEERLLRKAIKLSEAKNDGSQYVAMGNLGRCLREQHRFDEADLLLIEAWENLKQRQHPNAKHVGNYLAKLRSLQGRYDEAVQIYEETGSASLVTGVRYGVPGDWTTAANEFEKQDLNNASIARYHAICLLAIGDFDAYGIARNQSLDQFSKSDSPATLKRLFWIWVLHPIPGDKHEQFVEMATFNPSSSDYQLAIAATFARCGKSDEAIDQLLQLDERWESAEFKPLSYSRATIWFFLTMAYSNQGDEDEAIKWFDRASKRTKIEAEKQENPTPWDIRLINQLLQDELQITMDATRTKQ